MRYNIYDDDLRRLARELHHGSKNPSGSNQADNEELIEDGIESTYYDATEMDRKANGIIDNNGVPTRVSINQKNRTRSGKFPTASNPIVARCYLDHPDDSPFLSSDDLTICPICSRTVCRNHAHSSFVGFGNAMVPVCANCLPLAKKAIRWAVIKSVAYNAALSVVDAFTGGAISRRVGFYELNIYKILKTITPKKGNSHAKKLWSKIFRIFRLRKKSKDEDRDKWID